MCIMSKKTLLKSLYIGGISLLFTACMPSLVDKKVNNNLAASYNGSYDSTNSANLRWSDYFNDLYLDTLISTALANNQELNMLMQEISIAKNEVRARKGAYLPFVDLGARAGFDKVGEYTRTGAVDEALDIKSGKKIPSPLSNFMLSADVSWEVDIWKKLRNAKKASLMKYLATVEGKNFMVTNLIAEIADSYYELLALDRQLEILHQNITIQKNAIKIIELQKIAGMVTELAVRRFHAEVNKNESRVFYIEQEIIEAENKINYLVGRFPQQIERSTENFHDLFPEASFAGIPSQLLENRADIRRATQQLEASKLDVKVAKANFYPTFNITGAVGYEAFNTKYLLATPTSTLYNLVGGLVAPLINRNEIKAAYYSANSKQIQAAFEYEKTILAAYTEVVNHQNKIKNLASSYEFKEKQVDALNKSISISLNLFNQARADYVEVLLTQRDALEARMELVETKKDQLHARVTMYQALGGGWKR